MPMLSIEGVFKIAHAQPDGDSIRFYPNDPAQWSLVPGVHNVRTNSTGGAQLRLDAIDALETHYTPTGGQRLHQPLGLAHAAADRLLELLGFRNVGRSEDETVTASSPAEVEGYLLTRTADMYGRCVALAGRGRAPGTSGSQVVVKTAQLRKTVNYALMREGLVYPTYYRMLFADLRREPTAAEHAAGQAGIWAKDATRKGVTVADLATLTDTAVILPSSFAAWPTTCS